jgi:hypothetical protein
MDKYDAFQSAEYAADPVLGNLLQRWLVRIDYDCQTSWRDQLTTAWVAQTLHNVLLAVRLYRVLAGVRGGRESQ